MRADACPVRMNGGKFSPAVACVWLVAEYISLMNPKPQPCFLEAFSDFQLLSPGWNFTNSIDVNVNVNVWSRMALIICNRRVCQHATASHGGLSKDTVRDPPISFPS